MKSSSDKKKNSKSKKKDNFVKKIVKKLDVRKKAIPLLLAGTVLAGVGITSYKAGKANGVKESTNSYVDVDENIEGYDSIGFLGTGKVDDNNFVILDIGDHNTVETNFQNRKMKLCNKNDISLGVVISSDAENECDIYNDVDYVKGIIRDYKIDFPVYLSIDNIVNNNKLNNDTKKKLIGDFLEKCSKNGMYVGISGTDSNLCKLTEFFDTTEYDAFVIMDKENISYNGTYNVYKDIDGNVHSMSDLAISIKNANLNTTDKFTLDGHFVVNNSDEFENIALRYGMSEEDLLKFNGLKKKKLSDGKIVRVPCVYNNTISNNNGESSSYVLADEYLKGCDISYCQANNNNWPVLKENFDFIIIKCSQGTKSDDYFENNAVNCNNYGIPIGVYIYNNYWKGSGNLSEFKKLQQQQADYAVSLLKDKKIDYPVYLDIEKIGFTIDGDLPEEYANAMLDIWYNTISKAGYIPGLYFNQSTASNIQSVVSDYKFSDKFEVWIAGGPQYEQKYNGKYVEFEIDDIEVPDYFINNNFGVNMCQPGLVVNAGSGTSDGFLDFDYCKVDYANSKTSNYSNSSQIDDDIKEFNRTNKVIPVVSVSLAAMGIAGFAVKKYNDNKEKKKKNKSKTKTKKK